MSHSRKTARKAPQDPTDNLTSKQRLFAMEYLANGHNATKAAIAAGYSGRAAASQGSENLRKPEIAAFLRSRLTPRVAKLELTIDRLEAELARVAFFDPATMFDAEGRLLSVPEMPEDVRRALRGFDVTASYAIVDGKKQEQAAVTKVRLPSKVEALHLGMRRLGLLVEHVDVTFRTHAELVTEATRRIVEAKAKAGAAN